MLLIAASVRTLVVSWNDADVTMHYYHKNGNKYEEYSYNVSSEDGYPTKPVATYDSIDNIIAEKVALMYDTKNFKKA